MKKRFDEKLDEKFPRRVHKRNRISMLWLTVLTLVAVILIPRAIIFIAGFFRSIAAGGIYSILAALVILVIAIFIWRQKKLNKLKKDMGL